MASKDKEKSLLEIAIELLEQKKKPQKIMTILKEVMELKGVKQSLAKELAPQFLLDFMQCGYFVYCGDDCWDLKDRQPTSVLDKEGGDYDYFFDDDDEVKKNELKDEDYIDSDNSDSDDDEDEEEKAQNEIDDDLAKAFDEFDDEFNAGLVLVPEEGESEDEDEE